MEKHGKEFCRETSLEATSENQVGGMSAVLEWSPVAGYFLNGILIHQVFVCLATGQ
jgi:hypothetical protein